MGATEGSLQWELPKAEGTGTCEVHGSMPWRVGSPPHTDEPWGPRPSRPEAVGNLSSRL